MERIPALNLGSPIASRPMTPSEAAAAFLWAAELARQAVESSGRPVPSETDVEVR